jgi:endoglucanase
MSPTRIGIILVLVGVLLFAVVSYRTSHKREAPVIFSSRTMLTDLWEMYKKYHLEPTSGRTIDEQRQYATTSEGQSYTMLRAVWLDDKETFDKSWKWTKDNLQHQDDHLFSWLYGNKGGGQYGILTEQGGNNSASDADTDIALSLLFAYSRWRDNSYLAAAKLIITDIWDKEVIMIGGKPYLAANNIEKNGTGSIIINPSYFEPYAYRVFAKVDGHDWSKLIDTSYQVIEAAGKDPLDVSASAGLPPDWLALDRSSGKIQAANRDNLTSNFSFDALRIPWRLALDWQWNGEARAKRILDTYGFLNQQWQSNQLIYASYRHDGVPLVRFETPAMYGGTIGYFLVSNSDKAGSVYASKIGVLYDPDHNSWKQPLNYYDDNWAWFGLGLYNKLLPQLWSN